MSQHSRRGGWLVVNADDFGVSRGTTLGIVKAHRFGIVTSASLCVTTPHYAFAIENARGCPDLGIGLHLTLTSGQAAADPDRVPLLVDDAGYLKWRFASLLLSANAQSPELRSEMAREIDAQFAKLADDGVRPDHVNGERHVHLIPGIFEMVAAAARRHGVPFIRAAHDLGPRLFTARDTLALALNGGFVKWAVLNALTARARGRLGGLDSADHIASYLYTGRTASFLPHLLASPPRPGVTELMVHPAIPEEDHELALGNRELERYVKSDDRDEELQALRSALRHTGDWQLTNFQQLAGRRSP